jgi:N-methylhydantoinase B
MTDRLDPIQLEIFKSLFAAIAEEMGATLRRTAFSPNIKERRDYSCAVFDRAGNVVAQGDHMPVHLGSMPLSVRAAVDAVRFEPGDVVILNDPYQGGTHLPDVTMVSAVFADEGASDQRPLFYVANRAHHADIGGMAAGSMPLSTEIFQEGLRIPPLKLYEGGRLNHSVMRLILANVRTPAEREGDLTAQLAATRTGERRLRDMVRKYGRRTVTAALSELQAYAERMVRRRLETIPDGVYSAVDYLDDDGIGDDPVAIRVTITIRGDTATVDFTGSSPQTRGNINAVFAITLSAVFYVFRAIVLQDVPANAGILAPIRVLAPEGTVVNAVFPAAVAAGNVETSQRIVDVLLRALAPALPDVIPAASSGTMTNLALGGIDPRTQRPFAYYETVAGGMGASPDGDGDSGVHTHMTNSLNTPVEALEYALPVRVRRYALRAGSGGRGRWRGGEGIVREIEFLTEADISLLSDRRKFAPYGLQGGEPGQPGENILFSHGRQERLPGKVTRRVKPGDILSLRTPGGGGWGPSAARPRPPAS